MFFKLLFFLLSIALFSVIPIFHKRQHSKEMKYLNLILFSTGLWNFLQGLYMVMPNDNLKIFFHELKYVAIMTLPVFSLFFVLNFLNKDKLLKKIIPYFFIIPFITLVMIFTNNYHHFFRKAIWVKSFGDYDVVLTSNNLGFYLSVSYIYILFIICVFLLLASHLNSPRAFRKQLGFLILGFLIPIVFNSFYIFLGYTSKCLDPTPIAFSVSAFIFLYSVFFYNFLNLIPITRDYLFKNLDSPVIVLDNSNRIIDINKSAEALFSISLEECLLRNIEDLNWFFINDEANKFEINSKIYRIDKSAVRDSNNNAMSNIIVFTDITSEEAHLRQLEYMSFHDSLTNLYNRTYFNTLRDKINIPFNHPIAIIYGDLNGLKETNDIYGHEKGDEVLKLAANILSSNTRSDGYAIRLGGDEFCILLPKSDELNAKEIITKIHKDFETVKKYNISISLGYSIKSRADEAIDKHLKRADSFMYTNKKTFKTSM